MKTNFDMIGIFVENIGTMSAFYRDALGLACDWDGKSPYVEFQHAGIRFSMYERKALSQLLGLMPEFPKISTELLNYPLTSVSRRMSTLSFRNFSQKERGKFMPQGTSPGR